MSCHKCGSSFKSERWAECATCACKYHLHDCGSRYVAAAVNLARTAACPRCTLLCGCSGGPVLCHTQATKAKRRARLVPTKRGTCKKQKVAEEELIEVPEHAALAEAGWCFAASASA